MPRRFAVFALAGFALFGQSAVDEHLKRGADHMRRHIPGTTTPENLEHVRLAKSEFEAALNIEPDNVTAMRFLGSLHYYQTQARNLDATEKMHLLDEAERWFRRVASLDSRDKEAVYTLGVIAWSKAYPSVMQARQQMGMRPEDPGPLRDVNVRNELQARFGPIIHDGIFQLQTALAIDPNYDDAMAYMNLLLRLRADLSQSSEEYRAEIASADEWVQKALEIKKQKAGAAVGGTLAAPPPSPPPPPGLRVPPQIRVGANVQASKLIHAPQPEYPALARQARIQGMVRFNVVIGRDGNVSHITLVSGHPLLVPAATEALRQYTYQPTLLNGTPVEVVTVVDVPFTLGGQI